MKTKIILSFLIMFLGFKAHSFEVYEYQRPIRALGMGGVYIPFVRDTDAVMVNPAALARVQHISWRVFDVGVGGGAGGFPSLQSIQNLNTVKQPSDFNQFYGKKVALDALGFSSFAMPCFGIAAFDEFSMSTEMHNPAFPAFNVRAFNDYGGEFGFGIPVGDFLSVGLAAKRISRWGDQETLGLSTISTVNSNTQVSSFFSDKGIGYGADTAVMFKVPSFFNPTLAAVWKDVGDTSFTMTDGVQAPQGIPNNLAIAAGSSIDLPGLGVSAGIEYSHVMDSGLQLGQKLHFGTEFSLPLIDLRGGFNQGYPTYGIGVNFLFLELNAAYWGVETGAYPGQSKMDRFQVGLSMEFSIDANFNLYDTNGKRRSLKQRR